MNATTTLQTSTASSHEKSDAYVIYLKQQKRIKTFIFFSRIVLLILFLALWEFLAKTQLINPMLTSYPSAIWPTFIELLKEGHLVQHTLATLKTTLVGFTASMVFGCIVAALLWWSDVVYKILDPFMVIANALPKIALMPIFYIWLGSDYSVYGMAIAISIFVSIMVIYDGFRSIDPNKIKLATTLGANKWQVLTIVILPGSVPTLISALKMNIGLSLIGVIVGEFQSSNEGLGYLIINGSQIFKMNIVMTSITVLAAISGVMYLIVSNIEGRLYRRYA